MKAKTTGGLVDGARCKVVGGTHEGKSGVVRDIKTGKTGFVSNGRVTSNVEMIFVLASAAWPVAIILWSQHRKRNTLDATRLAAANGAGGANVPRV